MFWLSRNERELIKLMRSDRDSLSIVHLALLGVLEGEKKTRFLGCEQFIRKFALLVGRIDCQG